MARPGGIATAKGAGSGKQQFGRGPTPFGENASGRKLSQDAIPRGESELALSV